MQAVWAAEEMEKGQMSGRISGAGVMPMPDMGHSTESRHGQGMAGMKRETMQGGSAPADARDPHAYSDGYDFGPIPRPRFADQLSFGSLLADRFEVARTADNTSAAYDLLAWYGRDYNRVVIKADGEIDNGDLKEAKTELLWDHAVATYWDSQVGLRSDNGNGPDRTWLAFGIQGLAPYWFELNATGYVDKDGRTALNLEAEYELLFTQKLILQPRVEANIYGKDDRRRGIGSGLSDLAVGVRLRYELRREFAPYIGVEWSGRFGDTADYARDGGKDRKETQAVAGVRFWF